MSGIYRIRNLVNGRVYVGQAVNMEKRWYLHRKQLNGIRHHCKPLQHAWVKYGEAAFDLEPIEAVERNKAALDSREQVHLDAAFAAGLAYNTCRTAGSPLGTKQSAEACAKKGAAQRGRPKSPEAVAKTAAAHRGRKRSAETCEKIGAASRGRKHTAETRAKLSAGVLARNPEIHAKAAAANRGRKRSAETITKIRAGLRGRKHSVEAIANIVAAQQARRRGEQASRRESLSAQVVAPVLRCPQGRG